MKRNMLVGSVCVAACCAVGTASADVVGWWRFNGEGATVPNVAATADGLPDGTPRATDGTIVSIDTYGANPVYGDTTAQMPVTTNLFQQIAPRIVDQNTATVYAGGKSLHWEGRQKKGGVIIPFNEAFVLSNATIEVIMRIPPEAASRSDRMFPLVQFGRDTTEGWFFAVYKGDNVGGIPFVRGNFVDTSDANQTGKGSTSNATSYMKDMPSLFDGRWHHIALTLTHNYYNGIPRVTAAYFIDGVCCGGTTYSYWKSWKLSGNCPLAIGCQPYAANTRTFWGDIAEVRISDKPLADNHFLVPLADGPADDDMALMLTFDSSARGLGFSRQYVVPCQQTVGSNNTNYMWNARNWNIHNAAYNNPFIPRWYVFADKGNADHLVEGLRPTLSTDDTWGDTLGFDEKLSSNVGSLKITGAQPDGAAAPGTDVVHIPDPICRLPETNFTIECVFKTEAASTSEMDTFIYCPFLKWGVSNGKVLARGYGTRYGTLTDISSSGMVNDGQWHHAAVIYENGYFSHFVDYKRVKRVEKSLHVANLGANEWFFIGGQKHNFVSGADGAQTFQGKIDAVRITRRALKPGEFLALRTAETLMDATFDDTEDPYATGQAAATAPSGTGYARGDAGEPQIVQSRGGYVVLDGENGTNKVECGKAVQLDGGYVDWPRNVLLERPDLTVEFFAKLSSVSNSASIVRFCKGGSMANPVWTLWWQNNYLKVDGFLSADGGATMGSQKSCTIHSGPIDDNQWHHWALTIEPNADGSAVVFTVYRDYELYGQKSITGVLYFDPSVGAHLVLGGSGSSTAFVHGIFDNLRVSAGILPVDKFMRYDKVKNTVITVR